MSNNTVFARSTGVPCPSCLELYHRGEIQREAVMPLPKWGPTLRSSGEPCCFDCQAADTLLAVGRLDFPFAMARLPIANERGESLRLPTGSAECMGLCSKGIMRPASLDDLNDHMQWLDKNVPVKEEWDNEY